ncbi:unnamed protein product [Durusdinium trenchii]|uniref:Uncharacterized protein n=1 Tax=Durusdinium trenchii TaxID=1381693 RepID=A0ABP0QK03_9DINO
MWAAIQLLMMKLMAILAAHRERDASGDGSPRGSRPAHNEPPPGPSPPPGPQMEEAEGHLHLEWNAGYPVAPAQFIPCILHGGHFQTQPMCQWPGWPGWGSMVPAPMVTVPAPNESCCPPDHRLEEDTAPAPMPGSVDLTGDDDKKTDDPAAHPNGKEDLHLQWQASKKRKKNNDKKKPDGSYNDASFWKGSRWDEWKDWNDDGGSSGSNGYGRGRWTWAWVA